jgi:hypothetical protein
MCSSFVAGYEVSAKSCLGGRSLKKESRRIISEKHSYASNRRTFILFF